MVLTHPHRGISSWATVRGWSQLGTLRNVCIAGAQVTGSKKPPNNSLCASSVQRPGRKEPSCQVARSSGWPWHGPWCGTHLCSSWTKPLVLWMQRVNTW